MSIITRIINKAKARFTLACMLLAIVPAASAFADVTINIGGNVYGGGKQGAVGTGNTTATNNTSANSVTITDDTPVKVTDVKVNEGTIEGDVFGGGKDGRSYGGTEVTINGGTIEKRVFGAGEGPTAVVFGHGKLKITGGEIQDNVYGGGNEADLIGSATVILQGGSLKADVYGGSRIADIKGHTFIHIDGAGAKNDLIIKNVYGGNDISGRIQSDETWYWTRADNITTPFQIANNVSVNSTWNAFIRSTASSTYNIFIGKLYGGGRGESDEDVYKTGGLYAGKSLPEIDRVYMQIEGGNFGYLLGGGNNATVTTSTDIYINNISDLVELDPTEFESTDISETAFDVTTVNDVPTKYTALYQFDGVFGGNDHAEMKIRPNWYLIKAKINNLYSGGNAGSMTYYETNVPDGHGGSINKGGILLELKSADLEVENVYGGCRKADVQPTYYTQEHPEGITANREFAGEAREGIEFPDNYAARVLITAGKIKNVYGGNDVSGTVYGGNAVAILSTIDGDVYGGGNGNYPYTDIPTSDPKFSDYVFNMPDNTTTDIAKIEALNNFRPNAENVWLYVSGGESKRTYIGGSLYVGGNSATLHNDAGGKAELKLGSYVTADKVFLGSNGINMINRNIIDHYFDNNFSSIRLTGEGSFDEYMKGADVSIMPSIEFDDDMVPYTTYIGSFYVGGNAGSMNIPSNKGTIVMDFDKPITIYSRLVGGCNDANVSYTYQSTTVSREGGLMNKPTGANNPPKLRMNFTESANGGLHLMPLELIKTENVYSLLGNWNTEKLDNKDYLEEANIYGGCYNSGVVEGGVELNFSNSFFNDDDIFKNSTTNNSGITKEDQLYVFSKALSAYGGGKGSDTEIKGDVKININPSSLYPSRSTLLKVFGGGLEGLVNGNTTINLAGGNVGKVYGGGFNGNITGNTTVNLVSGSAIDAFAGACNADVEGYAQIIIGSRETASSSNSIPRVTNVYGGNDYSGVIEGTNDFTAKLLPASSSIISSTTAGLPSASTYVEFNNGNIDNVYGGSCGAYDYTTASRPFLTKAFVNFQPDKNRYSSVNMVFGAGQGKSGSSVDQNVQDQMQDRSYVRINGDNGATSKNFDNTDIFGSGAFCGLGMRLTQSAAASTPDYVTAVVDIVSGRVNNVHGASYNEGFTRRTMVNVPSGSKATVRNIFGGGKGYRLDKPCDTYEAIVNYNSKDAQLKTDTVFWVYRYTDETTGAIYDIDTMTVNTGAIYGGNNEVRRTLYSKVNVDKPVSYDNGYSGTIFGAGYGPYTWSQYTEVNLLDGAEVYEVYGGGRDGRVLSKETFDAWSGEDVKKDGVTTHYSIYKTIGNSYTDNGLAESLTSQTRLYPDSENSGHEKRFNTNVHINEGAKVWNYCYGGGLGANATVSGTTYIDLLGGTVKKDLYAGGTGGAVVTLYGANFTSEANAYIEGGSVRNVYGGGWQGNVGYRYVERTKVGDVVTVTYDNTKDIVGNSNVVIGKLDGTSFVNGIPTVQRNAYGGGEGGAIFGTANLTINNGYIGYTYNSSKSDDPNTDIDERYEEKLHDETWTDKVGLNRLVESGNAFGGGYVDSSIVDVTNVIMRGGYIRNSLYGGGEVAPIGRGEVTENGAERVLTAIHKAGKTHVEVWGGHIIRNVFGGGKGYDNLGRIGNFYTDGYVFGSTEVYFYRGDVGTPFTVLEGDGNVFGGGNVGYVYSDINKIAKDNGENGDGYYHYTVASSSHEIGDLSEDCKVIIEPKCQVKTAFDCYAVGDFVGVDVMNGWEHNHPNWKKVDDNGINIGNAVFAGGNVSRGSDRIYANAKTVFGNATASVVDIFDKDMITIGEDGIGGLYGDGNLTFVDGYRELNITNYGTDYHSLDDDIDYTTYQNMHKRERAYYELKYKSQYNHTYSYYESLGLHRYEYVESGETKYKTFKKGQKISVSDWSAFNFPDTEKSNWSEIRQRSYLLDDKISENEWDLLDDTEKGNWALSGFCTLYLGRMLNSIQRADFCGIFGSRIVMRGAQDRVTNVADYTNYTINRVDEVSLNKEEGVVQTYDENADEYAPESLTYGNYFGIYSVVNYLGALTSDVAFTDLRSTKNASYPASGETFYAWKLRNLSNRSRNDGESANEVALASGVWLEILDKKTEKSDTKIYGPITGVVQLNLINVSPDEGGGYVYAKNEHRIVKSSNEDSQVTLAHANRVRNAVSYKQFSYYDEDDPEHEAIPMQTSGNFVNYNKRIIDDCYPRSRAFKGDSKVDAHYWYVHGEYYVYEQNISAYTGSSISYPKSVNIPLTITPESHGKLTLNGVYKNLYASWDPESHPKYEDASDPTAIIINSISYHQNDPISYWDYTLLTEEEQQFFTEQETYVCSKDITINNVPYTEGTVFLNISNDIKDYYVCVIDFEKDNTQYNEGDAVSKAVYNTLDEKDKSKCVRAFNPSNAMNHENGFLLTFGWDNPDVWSDYYYSPKNFDKESPSVSLRDFVKASEKTASQADYISSPTFQCTRSDIYGQIFYNEEDIIDETSYNSYITNNISSKLSSYGNVDKQATFEPVYIAVFDCKLSLTNETTHVTTTYNIDKGTRITESKYNDFPSEIKSYFDRGMLCVEAYNSDDKYYVKDDVIAKSVYDALAALPNSTVSSNFRNAYICSDEGYWGGTEFVKGQNYLALQFSNLTKEQRINFIYNYDALDLLSENYVPTVEGGNMKYYQGDRKIDNEPIIPADKQIGFAESKSLDYTATFVGLNDGDTIDISGRTIEVIRAGEPHTVNVIQKGDVLSNLEYESLLNYRANYIALVASGDDDPNKEYHIVKEEFSVGGELYTVGEQLDDEKYNKVKNGRETKFKNIPRSSLASLPEGNDTKRYYLCIKQYGTVQPFGTPISSDDYVKLRNEQVHFEIDGMIPSETSVLYVSREVGIEQLTKDRIITVVYLYDYIEGDEDGSSYETVRERHIVNIRVNFKSGLPSVGTISTPATVLPGHTISMVTPQVNRDGAFESMSGGWELFKTESEAINHRNGIEFRNDATPVYWYQDGYWLAYYASSYLGRSYSNPVEISVANYHRMADVMNSQHTETRVEIVDNGGGESGGGEDPEPEPEVRYITEVINDYMYLNNAQPARKRKPKVYINSAIELGKLAEFYAASKDGVPEYFGNIRNAADIDFIIDGDINFNGTWSSIGSSSTNDCFEGDIHGDGHIIAGLNHSLFDDLCGNVYNLGIYGTIDGSGVANSGGGKVENSWVINNSTGDLSSYNAVAGVTTVINSYYNDSQASTGYGTQTGAYSKPMKSFLDGEVAFNLNRFYLNKRYYDRPSSGVSAITYKYWPSEDIGVEDDPSDAYYPAGYNQYVEDRYGNVDFIYAGGTIPEGDNIRLYDEDKYCPIYPDDYIFFGQKLSYNIDQAHGNHNNYPRNISRSGSRLQTGTLSNRVYRAAAYLGTSDKETAYYNINAAFAASFNGTDIYKGLTAIDFTGIGQTWTDGSSQESFFGPLRANDYEGLASFRVTDDITQNLLVYADFVTDKSSHDMLNGVLHEPELDVDDIDDVNNELKNIAKVNDNNIDLVIGHLVSFNGVEFISYRNHFLVDKEDFNAPISYSFYHNAGEGRDYRMWYQRTPDEDFSQTPVVDNPIDRYINKDADGTYGWQTISLPFTAELVTTNQKGEITHFYNHTDNNKNESIGHEYWLRELSDVEQKTVSNNTVYTGMFSSPDPDVSNSAGLNVKNKFLYTYYYSATSGKDKNDPDSYWQTYYNSNRNYEKYPVFKAGMPYLIGFPGKTFYEFDLSGEFLPKNTKNDAVFTNPATRINRQTITFVSGPGVVIDLSDDEYDDDDETIANGGSTSSLGYTFRTSYQGRDLAAGAGYLLNSDAVSQPSSKFVNNNAAVTTVPFRPYFTYTAPSGGSGAANRAGTRADVLYIGYAGNDDSDPIIDMVTNHGLFIYSENMTIVIESTLEEAMDVTITNTAGSTLKRLTVQPGTKEIIPVNSRGIYIVNRQKVAVTK